MNLWLRLIWFLLFSVWRGKKTSPIEKVSTRFLIGFLDCDINGHLTNSRYSSFMDLARFDFFSKTGLWNPFSEKSAFPILQGFEISFIRPIYPYQSIIIETSLIGYDEKYCYIRQDFYCSNQLVSSARVRGILCNHHGQLCPLEAILGLYFSHQDLPPSAQAWKDYLQIKKIENL